MPSEGTAGAGQKTWGASPASRFAPAHGAANSPLRQVAQPRQLDGVKWGGPLTEIQGAGAEGFEPANGGSR